MRYGRCLPLVAILGACSAPAPSETSAGHEALIVGGRAVMVGTLVPARLSAIDEGRMDGSTILRGATLELARSPAQDAELTRLLAEQADPRSPRYRAWLSTEEYGARFGAPERDRSRIVEWLVSEGLEVTRSSRSGTEITFAGSVAAIEKALHTELRRYRADGALHFAMARDPSVPADLRGIVGGVRGLDDFALRPLYTLSGQHHVAAGDFATIYDAQTLYPKGIDGTGLRIAIVGATFYTTSDITTYRTLMGLPPIDLTNIMVPGSGTASFVDPVGVGEAELDIELASAVARKAKIVYVYTGGGAGFGIRDALAYAVDNHVADVVSVSWGGCEKAFAPSGVTALETVAKAANVKGMTVVAASGDSGAAGCDNYGLPVAKKGPAVLLPSSLPEVTAVGGSEFVEGAGVYWSATNGANLGSALSYIPEMAWNDTVALGGLWAGGGGPSTLFAKPSWQSGKGVPADGQRDVPDVVLNASGNHDAMVVYWTAPAAKSGSGFYFVAGTSASAPSFAGIVALVAQASGSTGLGNINPMLYALAGSHPEAFHDITLGNNIVPCQAATPGCPSSPPLQYGFAAGPGYDLATGLGSIDTAAFVSGYKDCLTTGCGADAGGDADAGALGDAGAPDSVAGDSATGDSSVGSDTSAASDTDVAESAVADSDVTLDGAADSATGPADAGETAETIRAAETDPDDTGVAISGAPSTSGASGCGCKVARTRSDASFASLAIALIIVLRKRRTLRSAAR